MSGNPTLTNRRGIVRGDRRRSDPMQELDSDSFLGLSQSAISHFSIGNHSWTRVSLILIFSICGKVQMKVFKFLKN